MCVCNKYLVKTAVFVLWSCLKSEYINSNTRFTHPFNGSFSRTTRVSRYQKGKTNLDFTEASGSEWQWHQWGHVQVCISLQTDNHASTPPLKFFLQADALPAAQPTASKHWRQNILTVIRIIIQDFYRTLIGPVTDTQVQVEEHIHDTMTQLPKNIVKDYH